MKKPSSKEVAFSYDQAHGPALGHELGPNGAMPKGCVTSSLVTAAYFYVRLVLRGFGNLKSDGLLVIRNRPKPTDTINGLRIRRWIWGQQ